VGAFVMKFQLHIKIKVNQNTCPTSKVDFHPHQARTNCQDRFG